MSELELSPTSPLRSSASSVYSYPGSVAGFRSLIQHAADIITILDIDGAILFESPAVERVLGYPVAGLIGVQALSLAHPDDIARGRQLLSELRHAPRDTRSTTMRFRHADGSWRDLELVV